VGTTNARRIDFLIIIMGPELANFEFESDDRILGDYVFDNMHTYWFNRMKRNEKFKKIAFLLPNKVVPFLIHL
jgi:hypothetical protein